MGAGAEKGAGEQGQVEEMCVCVRGRWRRDYQIVHFSSKAVHVEVLADVGALGAVVLGGGGVGFRV